MNSLELSDSKGSDSLKHTTAPDVLKAFQNIISDRPELTDLYAVEIVKNADRSGDTLQNIRGYYLRYQSTGDPVFLDSLIKISDEHQNKEFLSSGYNLKGNYEYSHGNYLSALDFYLKARNLEPYNSAGYQILNFNIGLLKLELEDYEEALKLFFSYKKYVEKQDDRPSDNYISCLYAIAYTYTFLGKTEISATYVKQGLTFINNSEKDENFSNLLLVSGINAFKEGKYRNSVSLLKKVSQIIKENNFNLQNLALSEYYLSLAYYELHDKLYLKKLKSVDSVIISSGNITKELRGIYPMLIDYYKKEGNKNEQLFYIEHLLKFDSIMSRNQYQLSSAIHQNYDTPRLLREKEELIAELDFEKRTLIIISLLIVSGLSVFIILYLRGQRKIKNYMHQAELVLSHQSGDKEEVTAKVNVKAMEAENAQGIFFSDEKLIDIENKFREFENNHNYLEKNITLEKLAKNFNTNRAYLSKAVNEIKGKNFTQYINDMRIRFIIDELKTNPELQKFTIAGIADEAGFNNPDSFTNAFKKVTNTLPSYFLKAIKNKETE